eukprot:TRINITY_DN9358_c0_g1_i1.p2 TRINITY_DN9358_c0_g1~~TRINITY_DN9358_c0_g1_i1.p2  ORF type:complete len:476 (+),score=138.28 TRINITY_DN9358_c0_g1_i1:151-1428(+)
MAQADTAALVKTIFEDNASDDEQETVARPVLRPGQAAAAAPPAASPHPAAPAVPSADALMGSTSALMQQMVPIVPLGGTVPQRPMFAENTHLLSNQRYGQDVGNGPSQPNGPSAKHPTHQQPQPPAYEPLEPEKARRPAATETNTGTGAKSMAKSTAPAKRKRDSPTDVDIPDIDLNDFSTFNIVPDAQKFKKFLSNCIRNGSSSFTRGDATQITRYAARHSDKYFALKDGWTKLLKQLDEVDDVFKMWYAFDCLISMDEFQNPAVRATWEVKLPELVVDHMDMQEGAAYAEKYKRLLHSWRGRLDSETMSAIRKKLQSSGVALQDTSSHARRFRYGEGEKVECLLDKEGVWASCTVKAIDHKKKEVTLTATGDHAHLNDITHSLNHASKVVRRARAANGRTLSNPSKRRREHISSPMIDATAVA